MLMSLLVLVWFVVIGELFVITVSVDCLIVLLFFLFLVNLMFCLAYGWFGFDLFDLGYVLV